MAAREVRQIFDELQDVVRDQQLVTNGDHERAASLIVGIGRCLEERITTSDFDLVLSILFPKDDQDGGILGLLQSVRSQKNFASFKAESCKIITSLLSKATRSFRECEGHRIKVTAVLLQAGPSEASKVRVEALHLLVSVLAACAGTAAADSMAVPQLVRDLLEKDLNRATPPSVRQHQLHLLGALCQHYPATTAASADRICGILLFSVKQQLDSASAKVEKAIIAGALQGLTCFLHSFSKSPDDDPEVCRRIYDIVKRIINPGTDLARREAPRAGLELLTAHAAQFGQHLWTDYRLLFDYLLKWAVSRNRDDSRVGVHALDALLNQLCQRLLDTTCSSSSDSPRTVFSFLLSKLDTLMDAADTPPAVASLALRGYGLLAAPCQRLKSDDGLRRLVTSLALKAEQHFTSGAAPTEERLQQLAGYVWALGSGVCQLADVAADQHEVLERLLLMLADQYPRLLPQHRPAAHGALAHTLLALLTRPDLAEPYLGQLVFQMLLCTCSHPVAVQTDLEKDSAVSYSQRAIGSSDFLPLWDALLAAQNLRYLTTRGVTVTSLSAFSEAMYRALMEAAQKMMADLDLTTERQDDSTPAASGDPAAGIRAKMPKNFVIFINLVDVLEHVLLSRPAEQFAAWLPVLTRQLVAETEAAPLASGLYRLCRVCLLLADQLGYFTGGAAVAVDDEERRALRRLLAGHVSDTADRCRQYRDELQAACVSMVLATPAALAADCTAHLLQAAQVALQLGRGHLPLAGRALDALDRWLPAVSLADCADQLRQMSRALNQYLSPDAVLRVAGSADDETRHGGSRRLPAVSGQRIARAPVWDESELSQLRSRVLQLLGQLAALDLVAEPVHLTAWSRAPTLDLAVPFHDIKPTLCLEAFLPRVVQLALSSGDAQAKVSACELLHAITIFTIGRGARLGVGSALQPVYARLLPALVQLAAGSSLAARQLFSSLLMQITHWFTTDQMYRRPESAVLLQTLLDGLVDVTEPARRDVCAQTLRDFLLWSLKQRHGNPVEKVAPVMKPLFSYLRHPDPYRRLGGTLAFNSVYTVLREDHTLLNVYLLAVTVALLSALARAHADPPSLGTAQTAADAVSHCRRMLIACTTDSRLPNLCQVSADRQLPADCPVSTLPELLKWLVTQSGAPQIQYRRTCLDLIQQLSPHVPGAGSICDLLEAGGGAVTLFEHTLSGVHRRDRSGAVPATAWLHALLAALDGYDWALELSALTPASLLDDRSFLLENVRFLLAEAFDADFGGGEQAVRRLRCWTLVRAVAVLECVLRRPAAMPAALWSQAATDTLARAVLTPAALGFNVHDAEAAARLPTVLEQLLRAAARAATRQPAELLGSSLARLTGDTAVCDAVRSALRDDARQSSVQQLLRGLRTLHDSGLLPKLAQVPSQLRVSGDELWRAVWGSLAGLQRPQLSPAAQRLADTALTIALHLDVTPKLLFDSLLPMELERGGGVAERGWLLFGRLSASLVPALLRPQLMDNVLTPLVQRSLSHRHGLDLVTAVVRVTVSDRHLRHRHGAQLAKLVVSQWRLLSAAADTALLPLLRLLLMLHVSLAGESWAAELVAWYRRLLTNDTASLEQQTAALRLLYAMLSSPQLADHICDVLGQLESRHFPLDSAELAAGSRQRASYCAALAALCETVEMTAQPTIAGHMAALLAREAHHPCADQLCSALRQAMIRHGVSQQLAVAAALWSQLGSEAAQTAATRLTLLTSYLCPLLRAADRAVLLDFFTANVADIMRTVQAAEPAYSEFESEATAHAWVTRTASFSLMEVLYATLPKEHVHSVTSPLVVAFVGSAAVSQGNELTKALMIAGTHATKAPPPRQSERASVVEARRRCFCATYNALTAAVCTTQTESRFYNGFLFSEQQGKVIWPRLVDAKRRYTFLLDRAVILERREVPVQRSDPTDDTTPVPRSAVSQFLSDSSLSSQVTQYDFTTSVVLNSQEVQQARERKRPPSQFGSVQLERDDLNEHECMACLSALVLHMVETVDCPPELGPPPELAGWLESIRTRLNDPNTADNVVLLLVRLVTNSEAAFRPYAGWLLVPLLRLTERGRLGTELNALLLDLVSMLSVWAQMDDIVPDDTEEARAAATAFLAFIVRLSPHHIRAVAKNMIRLFSCLVASWSDRAAFPADAVLKLLTAVERQLHCQLVAVSALGVALLNHQPLQLTPDLYHKTLGSVLDLLKSGSAELYKPASQVVALMCAQLLSEGNAPSVDLIDRTLDKIKCFLQKLEGENRVRWVTCLSHMSGHCRQLAASQRARLLYLLPSLYGPQKALGLQVLHDIVEDVPDVYLELMALKLADLVQTRDRYLQEWSLRILIRVQIRLSADECAAFLSSLSAATSFGDTLVRKLAAELSIALRQRFRGDSSAAGGAVTEAVTETLLRLLIDPDLAVRQIAANHWADGVGLQDTTPGRLALVLTSMFRPGLEAAYLSYSTYLVLGLAARSPDYSRKMFDKALPDCQFQDQAIVNSWRVQSAAVVPLFSQSATVASGWPTAPLLQATQASRKFTPTQQASVDDATFDWLTQASVTGSATDALSAGTSLPLWSGGPAGGGNRLRYRDAESAAGEGDASQRGRLMAQMLRRRYEADPRRVSARFARINADQRALQDERQLERSARQDAKVELMRTYRTGELPDTEIPYSDLIRPLQALAMHDSPTGQRLLVELLAGTLAELTTDERSLLLLSATKGLTDILERLRTPDPSLVSAALQAALRADIGLPHQLVVSVCKTSGQFAAGILLLEHMLETKETKAPPEKRPRDGSSPDDRLWTGLAELYREYGDWDCARAAFSRRAVPAPDWAAALDAEASGRLLDAARHYERTLEGGVDDIRETSYYQCLSELSEWKRLSASIDQKLTLDDHDQPDLNLIWKPENESYIDHVLPWLMRSKTQLSMEGEEAAAEQLRTFINGCQPELRQCVLEGRFPEELALLYVSTDNLARARFYCNSAKSAFMRDWNASSTSGGQSRNLLLQQLRRITEMQEYLTAAAGDGPAAADVIRRWQNRLPAVHDRLAFWDSLITRRQLYTDKLGSLLEHSSDSQRHLHRSRLRLVETALAQRNVDAAVVHLGRLRSSVANSDPDLRAEYHLLRSRTALLKAQTSSDVIKAWRVLENKLPWQERAATDAPHLVLKRARLEADLAQRLVQLPWPTGSDAHQQDQFVQALLAGPAQHSGQRPAPALLRLALDRLSTAANMDDQAVAAAARLEAAQLCSRHMDADDGGGVSDQLRGPLVTCTLSAMAAGSTEASAWLPRLLQLADDHADAAQALRDSWEAVPVWMFLDWLPQLFSYGASTLAGETVRLLLLRLAEQYPQAVVYPLTLYRTATDHGPPNMETCLQRLDQLLKEERLPSRLVSELAKLAQWPLQLLDRLQALSQRLGGGRQLQPAAVSAIWAEASELVRGPLSEAAVPVELRQLGRQLVDFCGVDGSGITDNTAADIQRIIVQLQPGLKNYIKRPSTALRHYSVWLATFQDVKQTDRLEVPGQYSGRSRPQPDRHVLIANFDQQVRVLYSKELPVCVTMRGDDAAEYRYLVKSGDDTRTDQRVQQLFTVINSSLAADVRTGDRRLAIRTYKVLPLKPTLGLIEWVDNTETLREFLASASARFGEQSEAACRLQVDQMQLRCDLRAAAPLLHGPYLVTADRQSVVDDFRRRQATLPAGLIREALLRLSCGPDTFLRLRTNAAVSLALQAAAGWLLGVGDRHLKNFLVSLDDGVVIAIDFGHAFGSATHLPVPEVVPFRLTPQLASVAGPLGTSGVIQQTMVRTLQALRSSHQLLAATLEVFVREPTIDWTKRARKDIATHDADAVLRWSRQCVSLARGRLQGAHPSADLCQLLRTSDLPQRQRYAWIAAVRGRSGLDPRADLPDRDLTVQQQVTCLLDLATDQYILGLTWTRWEAHI